MLVKLNEKQLSFLFQETDSYFELGQKILEQANLAGTIPARKIEHNGREKLLYSVENLKPLQQVLPEFTDNEIIDVFYALFFMTEKVEENGFLKKECIWNKFEHIFYDERSRKPFFVVLPVNEEFRYTDKLSWYDRLLATVYSIARYMTPYKGEKVINIARLMKSGKLSCEEALEAINELGSGLSGTLVDRTMPEVQSELNLTYSGREGTFTFTIGDRDFIIGKNPDAVDGVIHLSNAVSRVHCKVIKQGKRYFVQDLGSVNHTYVNGEILPPYELTELTHDDVLMLADVELRAHIIELHKEIV